MARAADSENREDEWIDAIGDPGTGTDTRAQGHLHQADGDAAVGQVVSRRQHAVARTGPRISASCRSAARSTFGVEASQVALQVRPLRPGDLVGGATNR